MKLYGYVSRVSNRARGYLTANGHARNRRDAAICAHCGEPFDLPPDDPLGSNDVTETCEACAEWAKEDLG